MRTTPHYPPPQPNTSARANVDYNTYSPDQSLQSAEDYAEDYYNHPSSNVANRPSQRAPAPLSSSQRANRGPRHSSQVSQQQQQQQQQQQRQLQRRVSEEEAPPMDDNFKSVVYTLQDTFTDTHANETEYGGVLTIRTTTVTRTITERLVRSDEDEDSSEEEGEEEYHDDA